MSATQPGQKARVNKPLLVLGAMVVGLLAAVVLGWREILKQKQDPNDWKGFDKKDTGAK
jgi:hypothetical protein